MTYDDTSGTQTIELQKVLSLKYSNTNFRYHGLVIGMFTGFIIPALLRPEGKKDDPNCEICGLGGVPDKYFIAFLIASPVGAIIGYMLGSKYYYKWQEYDLGKEPPKIHTINQNRSIMIFRLTFPIH